MSFFVLHNESAFKTIKSGDDMDFESLLCEHKAAIERFVHFHISNRQDAEDVLQETFLTAFRKFDTLKNKACFKAWLLSVARNKCNDYYRKSAQRQAVSDATLNLMVYEQSCCGIKLSSENDILSSLKNTDKEILYDFYYMELTQKEISERLHISVGTVKSRLYYARENFKTNYPYTSKSKGENVMKLPKNARI